MLSHLGEKDLEKLIASCHAGTPQVRVYADLVINHMANEARDDRFDVPGEAELQRYQQVPALYAENRLYGDLSTGLFTGGDFNHAGELKELNGPISELCNIKTYQVCPI